MATVKEAKFIDGVEVDAAGGPSQETWEKYCKEGKAQRSRVMRNGIAHVSYVRPIPEPEPGDRSPAPPKPTA